MKTQDRKRIFIIHGKGVVEGIGMEGGGDLDTVGSNAFYGSWIRGEFAQAGKEPVYGADYEYDFVNYSEGLSHLVRHSGCDIYLPDFPIDALAPRMTFTTVTTTTTAKLRNSIAIMAQDARSRALNNASSMSQEAKELYNDISKKLQTLRKSEDLEVLSATLSLTSSVFDALLGSESNSVAKSGATSVPKSDSVSRADSETDSNSEAETGAGTDSESAMSLLKGAGFSAQMDNMAYVLDRIEDFLDTESSFKSDSPGLEQDLKALRRALFMTRNATNLHTLVLEAMTLPALLDSLEPHLSLGEQRLSQLRTDTREALAVSWKTLGVNRAEANADDLKKGGNKYQLIVHLCEDSSGKPVHSIPLTFKTDLPKGWKARMITTENGKTNQSAEVSGKSELEGLTDMDGVAILELIPPSATEMPTPDTAIAWGTYDGINWLTWPLGTAIPDNSSSDASSEMGNAGNEAAADDGERKLTEELAGPEVSADESQETPATDRVTANAVKIIERDIRFLAENDVRIVRVDDHHPWTPAIHELLQSLEGEGLIGTMRIHAYERGREMEKDQSLCGADLIYQAMIKGKPWDNDGLVELQRLAHVQDLHLMEDKLAIDLSKLIGSGFSKVEMAKRLAQVKDHDEMVNIMERAGWAERVAGYEGGLAIVLPRLFRSMARVTLRDNEGNLTKIIMILAPFTDRKIGEAKINVASAINFLKDKVEMDFLFYCYGSTMMTTRKTGEDHSPIDLSLLSQHAGTKSDGGHAEAATCKPGSNPTFPGHLFAKLNDTNFLEYANYIGTLTAQRFELSLHKVEDVIPPFHEDQMEQVCDLVWQNLFIIRGKNGSDDVNIGVLPAPRVSKKDGQIQPTVNAVVKTLAKNGTTKNQDELPDLDYLMYCRSGSISLRPLSKKVNAAGQGVDFTLFSSHIGDNTARVSPFSACFMPRQGPLADPAFNFHSAESFPGYLRHLADALDQSGALKVRRVEPVRIPHNILNTTSVVNGLERCAKKAALLHVMAKPKGLSWKKELRGLAGLASKIGTFLPSSLSERWDSWLYTLDPSKRATILVVPFSPRGGNGFEATAPLIASGLVEEFNFQGVILVPNVDLMAMVRTDNSEGVLNHATACDLIDGVAADHRDWGTAICYPSRSKVLPQNLRQINDANFHLCLDWIARVLEASGQVSVISISRARTS
ncbi:MAG: hypothetical protein CVV64_14175 [Candidatus Wallbacteria bacterium HGW-Wallbacteria-1]|jgi:hypothetical protein|uniref:Uncharacterized protein n=1 Tax=Candidatus Wallbacteria bacterium HGW-Wallbacteria-1 TaxID=2013854 RepID=A0A2N1PMI6_9BACT|nr:MAG: hypothetical protein CVV64_14175 [Candidatus Wallbacteria bacterium HGW-Wallbacteria-1]